MYLFDEINALTIKSPLQYPGGKHFARQVLSEHIPFGIKQIISPFFGGGSLELYLAGKRHIKVKGYDAFEPLVNFWNAISDNPQLIFQYVDDTMKMEKAKALIVRMKNGKYSDLMDSNQKAAMFYLMQALSYNSTGFRGKTIKNYAMNENGSPVNPTGKSWGIMFNHHELKDFHNPLISVYPLTFEVSLTLKDNDGIFAYCDPPYPDVSGMYGDSTFYHEDFDHQKLKSVLDNRSGDWLLSYNNCETVRNLYPDNEYKVIELEWKQGSRKTGKGKEVLIKRK